MTILICFVSEEVVIKFYKFWICVYVYTQQNCVPSLLSDGEPSLSLQHF